MADIFIAYSHEDLAFKDELKKFLRPMLRDGRISVWDDYDIEAGQDWDASIKQRLYGAGVILLLVSADSLASDYFFGKEVHVSLERHTKGEAVVVPIILRHCDWEITPLAGLEALPEKGRPVVEWPTRDQAWQDVVSRLRRVVDAIEARREKEAASAEQHRRYTAAVNAADHLAQKNKWKEAHFAYADALALCQPGYVPDRADIERRMADCDSHLRAEVERRAEQERQAEAGRQRAEQERRVAESAERQRVAAENRRHQAANPIPTVNTRRILVGTGAVLLLVLILWNAFGRGSKQPPPPPHDNTQVQLETVRYNKALEVGTIPALQGYLDQYPAGSNANVARKKLVELQNTLVQKMQSARSYEAAEEWRDAFSRYNEALRINPEDPALLRKVEELRGKL